MPIDPTDLAKSIGALGSLDPERGLAATLQQIADAANQLVAADAAGLMLVDADGQLRRASAADQIAQTIEDGQERLAQGPCAVAFSQRLPAVGRCGPGGDRRPTPARDAAPARPRHPGPSGQGTA
jgi:hypothetical protein